MEVFNTFTLQPTSFVHFLALGKAMLIKNHPVSTIDALQNYLITKL